MARKRIKAGARQRDVAAAAGVSTATVSAVVNGRAAQYGICRATQEKVMATIRQMGYTPSLSALDMVAGRNSLVGLAITADTPGADRLIAAMEPALAQVGLRLLVACLPADPAGAATRITDLARYGVGAVALFPARALPLPGISCPVVMVGKAGVGVPAECSPTAVTQLGLAAARWLQLASQGSPPGELLLEPAPGVVVATPTPTAVPSKPQPSTPPAAVVPPPRAVSPPNPVAATPVIPAPSMHSSETADPLIGTSVQQPASTPAEPSESIQMPETVVFDPVGQATSDPQETIAADPEPEPMSVAPAEPVAPSPETDVSWPSPGSPMSEPIPDSVSTPAPPPEPITNNEEPTTIPSPTPEPEPTPPPPPEPVVVEPPPAPEVLIPEPPPEPEPAPQPVAVAEPPQESEPPPSIEPVDAEHS